jgi:ABC-type transporter Mla subunit MlaD
VRPGPQTQIRWGVIAAALAAAVVALLAFIPDPLLRQKVYATTFDDVEAISRGLPVFFRGAEVGQVRSVDLDPDTKTFTVRLGIRRDWRPTGCSYARIVESNPVTAPKIEVAAIEGAAEACKAAMAKDLCTPLPAPKGAKATLTGCRRGANLFETAAIAVAQAAEVAKTANAMALRLQAMLEGGASSGGANVDVQQLMTDAAATLHSVNEMTDRLNRTMAPGTGDVAVTLSNVRRASGQAAQIDVATANATLADVQALVRANQASVNTMLSQGAALSGDSRALLENVSATLASAAANLERVSTNVEGLSERVEDDPTYLLRGQRYADPPPPGASR